MLAAASRQALSGAREALTDMLADVPDADAAGASEGLFAVVRLLDGSGQLLRALADPTTPHEAKEQLLDQLLGGKLDGLALQTVKQAVTRRWSSARDLVDAVEILAVQAAFLRAHAEGSLDDVEDQLFRFSRIVAQDPSLRAVLTDRALGDDRKTALLDGLLADRARAETVRLISALVLAPRGRTLEDGLAEYSRLAAQIRDRSVAYVTSAVRLDEGQEQRLAAALAHTFGREVQLQVDLDPAVVGGLFIRVGDEVIDATTRHHLRAARIALNH